MYRSEYPRPSFVRSDWQNFNGQWDFKIDNDSVKIPGNINYDMKIEVPFCPESKLSGIEHKDFMTSVWYRRTVAITEKQLLGRVIINFGAVDYIAELFVNGKKAGTHRGGYISFSFDITNYLIQGENVIELHAIDDHKNLSYPSGKQCNRQDNYGCMYTRTTGIWQTVWLEFVNKTYITYKKITPSVENGTVEIDGCVESGENAVVNAEIMYNGKTVSVGNCVVKKGCFKLEIKIDGEVELWDVLKPELYDIILTVTKDGEIVDNVKTYFGFRSVELKDGKFLLNGKPVFLRQILDQGFYPDGVYTAPDISDIEKDIDIALKFGFNGARPHQKIFEEQYLYYADKKGYLIWGEFPNWSCNLDIKRTPSALKNFLSEWREELIRDYDHPSIIGWCPLNEVWENSPYFCDAYCQTAIYAETKKYDPLRPVIGASGGNLYVSDINDYHDYSHTAKELTEHIYNHTNGGIPEKKLIVLNKLNKRKLMTQKDLIGLPIFLSEYGGIAYANEKGSWGYVTEENEEDYVKHYTSDTSVIINSDCMGMCYTQLTDVQQEQNGLVTYDRQDKLSPEAIKKIFDCNTSKAKIED